MSDSIENRKSKIENRPGRLIVISGPSGVGKSTVTRQVLERTGAMFSISATTRQPRAGEQNGREYHFVDVPTFQRMIAENALLEWAEVFGHYYGTPAQPVKDALAQGQCVVLEIDVQGGIQVAKRCPDAAMILITPPDAATLAQRLAGRATDAPEVIARRLAKAQAEMNLARESGVYKYEVVNRDLPEAVAEVLNIIAQEIASA